MKPVAREGDTRATASNDKKYPKEAPTATGNWSAGRVFVTPVPIAESDGKKIVCSATCTFTFAGKDNQTGADVNSTSMLTLTPATRKLKTGGSYPLVDGDKQTDIYDNELSVSSAATWRTA